MLQLRTLCLFGALAAFLVSCSVYKSSDREFFESNAKSGAPAAKAFFGPMSTAKIQASGASSCERVRLSEVSPSQSDSLDLSTQEFDSSIVETDAAVLITSAARSRSPALANPEYALNNAAAVMCRFEIQRETIIHHSKEDLIAATKESAQKLVLDLAQNAEL